MHPPAGPLFLDLADARAADPSLTGSFAAPLSRAAQGGAPVPVTAVVTAEACARLAEIDDVRAEYHMPGDPTAPRQDPAVRALALAWHAAGCGGVLPVVVHASPAGPYEHPALWREAITVTTWRRLQEAAVEIGSGRPTALVVQRAVAITTTGRAWPGEHRAPGDGLDRGQARRLSHMVRALDTPVLWALDVTGNVWILACLGAHAGAPPSAPACGAVA